MNSIDPATFASQLVAIERQGLDTQYANQQAVARAKISAFNALETKAKELQTALEDLIDNNQLQATKPTLSREGVAEITTDSGAPQGSYSLEVTQLAQSHQVSMDFTSETWEAPDDGVFKIEIDGKSMSLDLSTLSASANLLDLRDAINSDATNPGVQATVVRAGENDIKLVLTADESGSTKQISMSLTGGTPSAELTKLQTEIGSVTELRAAQNAELKFNGIDIVSTDNKLDDVISGITIDLKAETNGDNLVIEIARDDETIKESVTKFIDAYNALITESETQTASGYGSEDEVAGALSGDSTMRTLLTGMRFDFNDLPGGVTLSSLGIETDKYGKLSLNSSDFEDALDNNSAALEQALLGNDGLFTKLNTRLEYYVDSNGGVFDSRTDSLQSTIDRVDDKIEALDLRMNSAYQRYLAQFTQMNALQAQLTQTSSLFSF